VADELEALDDEEHGLRPKIVRSQRAEQILNDPLFVEAVEAIRQRIFEGFKSAKADDADGLKILNLTNKVLDNVLSAINEHIRSGHIAAKRITDIKTRKTFLERFRKAS
jgi:hypothetical protein